MSSRPYNVRQRVRVTVVVDVAARDDESLSNALERLREEGPPVWHGLCAGQYGWEVRKVAGLTTVERGKP